MAEDGYKLWLRYAPLGRFVDPYRGRISQIVVQGQSATARICRDELKTALSSLLGADVKADDPAIQDGAVIVGTPATSDLINGLGWKDDLSAAGPEGFVIRSANVAGHPVTVIASENQIGALHGVFDFLRLIQTCQPINDLNISEKPKVEHRLMDHWDNPDGSIERGYAGLSMWQWDDLPEKLSPRYVDYARACASIGINGSVLNNVNADPHMLSTEYLQKAAALADIWRPYGVRVYVSANCACPKVIGGLPTSDPLDESVAAWWKTKADEIYRLIPDFGGFLVKANSEGQPGPQDYGRTHAQGANVMADALLPHGGIIMWRAFVYNQDVDPDRVKRAYKEFVPLDGQFRSNVIVQVKNGPLDFQPREPFHALFGAMKQTPVFSEFQAAQEYLGQSKHLVFLGTMWKEFLDSDTYAAGPGSTTGKVIDGSVYPYKHTGMVVVANTGSDINWCGHDFSQANWYAFGRLAWDHDLPAEHIAEDWIRMTFTNEPQAVEVIRGIMLDSRETYVSYTMPLGLHHLIGGDHYAPMPWQNTALQNGVPRPDWMAVYYHRATADGIGFDRTTRGSDAVSEYFPPVRDQLNDLASCPDRLLLWFHHVPWDHPMKSGKTLWQDLCDHYYRGHAQTVAMQSAWASLAGTIDPDRHQAVSNRLAVQVFDAEHDRDRCLSYFQQYSRMPIVPPRQSL